MTQLFYYSAPWCGPCQKFGPLVDQVTDDYDLEVLKINVDVHPEKAVSHNIWSVPVLILEKDGHAVGRLTGAVGEEVLRQFLEG